jgi:pilus assembly protein CpaB
MNRRVLAVFVAVLLAIAGAALVIFYAQNADKRAIAEAQPTTVYVAQKLIASGTTLKDAQRTQLLVQTQVAAKAVPAGALKAIDPSNNSLLALSDVQPGEILIASRFGTTPVGAKAIEVPSGMLAISVELSDPARVGKFVTPGSHIAIYASYKIKALGNDDKSKVINENDVKGTSLLMDDVLVIGMGETALSAPKTTTTEGAQAETKAPSFLVTLAVKPADAAKVVHGINNFTLYAALRGSDVKLDPKSAVNDMTVFGSVLP